MARTRLYRNGVLESEDFPAADVSTYLNDPTATVWLDMCSPTAEDLHTISDELSLHQLAVEDAVHEHQRPKLDRYETHAFLTAYAVRLDTGTGMLDKLEVAAFITPRAFVTVRKDPDFDIEDVVRRWDSAPEIAKSGVGFLVYGLLDYVVDSHFAAVQELDEQIEALEDLVFAEHVDNTELQRRSLNLRKSLVTLRRVVLPMREVANTLMRRDMHIVDDTLMPYYQDVYDHVLRASEWTDSLRDLVTTIRETQLALQGNRLNMIMKKVTAPPRWRSAPLRPMVLCLWFPRFARSRLGRDHRRAHRDHRLLWSECALSRIRETLGILGVHDRHGRHLRRSLRGLP